MNASCAPFKNLTEMIAHFISEDNYQFVPSLKNHVCMKNIIER